MAEIPADGTPSHVTHVWASLCSVNKDMKRTIHFSTVLGREGKFDPSQARNITIFNEQKEGKEPRRLDKEAAYRLLDRRVAVTTDLGGYNPRNPNPVAPKRPAVSAVDHDDDNNEFCEVK